MTVPTRAGFDQEILPHLDLLYRVALRFTREPARAEDLVQDTMVKAYRNWEKFEPGTSARAWLLAILRNTFINAYRREKREPISMEHDVLDAQAAAHPGEDSDPEGAFFDKIVDERILKALDTLPPEFREVMVLSDVEGLPYAEIAHALAIPVGTVKSRLFRARRLMQTELYQHALETGIITARSGR
ncbi:MAG TPA: sigma-70 family RNA polymerase sigma factor [Gemmatimonadales bacterium]|jgi:RNA polymerase sigma-70 factor (ECF subfamily)|nr:sigma-70 family RNA polymerase sigma factor [Gemmatimonadales bacterium]